MLPPGIQKDRLAGDDYAELRATKRRELGLEDDEKMVLMVGSGFKTKGLDRSLQALASLPQSQLFAEMLVSGQRKQWQENAKNYVENHDIFSMPQRAVDVIEQVIS
ncbi:MAG: hypothetical protein B6I37_05235 [Desulfobacteraceae bacterium 4572_35.2]|nr:MAG: hypothetical protein B6I37_05235 [Desulfobacteraceae bacterium 4572_35.2]